MFPRTFTLARIVAGWTLSIVNGAAILFLAYLVFYPKPSAKMLVAGAVILLPLCVSQYAVYILVSPPPIAPIKAAVAATFTRARFARQFRPNFANILPVLLYLVATAGLLWTANTSRTDDKSIFVLKQIPIALQLPVLGAIPFVPRDIGWVGAYSIIVPPTLALLYAAASLLRYLASAFVSIMAPILRSQRRE